MGIDQVKYTHVTHANFKNANLYGYQTLLRIISLMLHWIFFNLIFYNPFFTIAGREKEVEDVDPLTQITELDQMPQANIDSFINFKENGKKNGKNNSTDSSNHTEQSNQQNDSNNSNNTNKKVQQTVNLN